MLIKPAGQGCPAGFQEDIFAFFMNSAEHRGREVALAGVRKEGDNELALVLRALRKLGGCVNRGAVTDAYATIQTGTGANVKHFFTLWGCGHFFGPKSIRTLEWLIQPNANNSENIRSVLGIDSGDRVTFIVEGNTVRVVNSAVYALMKFQEQIKGEAERACFFTEDDVAEWVTASRREENAE